MNLDMLSYDVAIIGAGMAGLACARTLEERGVNFVLIAPNIGGDVRADHGANMGAYLLTPSAQKLIPSMKAEKRVWLGNTIFWGDTVQPIYKRALSPHLLSLYKKLRHFRKQFLQFQQDEAQIGLISALSRSPDLQGLQRVAFVDYAGDAFSVAERLLLSVAVDPVVRMCTLAEPAELSAFEYLHVAMHIDIPVHTFIFDADTFIQPFAERYIKESVTAVEHTSCGWRITTQHGECVTANSLVAANGAHHSPHLFAELPVSDTRFASCILFHVRGTIRSQFSGQLHVFPVGHPVYFLQDQGDGTVIIALKDDGDSYENFVRVEEVLSKATWKKAFPIGPREWTNPKISENLYILNDRNIVGIEDSYRSGLWVGRALVDSR